MKRIILTGLVIMIALNLPVSQAPARPAPSDSCLRAAIILGAAMNVLDDCINNTNGDCLAESIIVAVAYHEFDLQCNIAE